jgi:hypothetical protein
MFKLGGQIIKLSVSNCVDVFNEFSGYGLAIGDLNEYMPNKFSVRYHYKNCICLLWLFTKMGLTIESEVQLGIYESGAPMYFVNLKPPAR